MDGGIENLASLWEATKVTAPDVSVSTEQSTEETIVDDVQEEQKKDEEEQSWKTLSEVVYEKSIEEQKMQKQLELEEEAKKYKIPDIDEPEKKEEEKEEVVDEVAVAIDEEVDKQEIKDVIEEINSEPDKDVQTQQRENLLISLREDNIALARISKEKDIEIKTLTKRIEELVEENKELKYSWRVKLDDELEHLNYLRDKVKKNPDDKESQKQLALYHAKALWGIYPEFDVQESFNQINNKRRTAIQALSASSGGYSENRAVEQRNTKIDYAMHGLKKK